MLNDAQIGEVWSLFADYIEKKHHAVVAERYIELLADYGVRDRVFQSVTGVDATLDQAISYYLDEDDSDEDEDYKELDF